MGILAWFWSWIGNWVASWLPLSKTMHLLLNKKARRSASYLESCRGSINVGLKISFIPFRYDEDSKTFAIKPQSRLISDFHFLLHLTWCVAQVAMGIHWYSTAGKTARLDDVAKNDFKWQKIVYFYYPSLGAGTIPIIYLFRKRTEELKPLLSVPFHMEQRCIDLGIKGYVKSTLLGVTAFAISSCFLLPIIYFVASLLRPCLPLVLVSLVTENCPTWGSPGEVGLAAKIFLGMYDYYAWVFLPGVYLGVGWVTLVYPGSASTRKIEYIMMELKSGNLEAMTGFREVQVMDILTNTFWKFPLMQLLLGQWLIAEVIALYTVIKLAGVVPIEVFVYFFLLSMDGAALIHVHFKLLSEPCLASAALFEYTKQMPDGGGPWMRRFVRSCSPFQIKMADGRFFDRTTPLVVWQFVVDRLVMCLLM